MTRPAPKAVLLVDGYNVVGTWGELRQLRDREGLDAARRQLVEILVGYSAYHGFHTELVFDAHYRATTSVRDVVTEHLLIHYTDFGQTADTYIEKFCAEFRHAPPVAAQRLIVATSDRAQQLVALGYGAEWMSTGTLAQDVECVTRKVRRQQKANQRAKRRLLGHTLDPLVQQRLAQLRLGQ